MKNWKKVKLGSLLTESKIVSDNPNPNNRIRVKLNVLGVEKRPVTKDKKGATRYYIRKAGQFIYGKQNLHKGAFGIVPEELDGYESSSDIPTFDIDESCYSKWIFYFFRKNNFYLKLEDLAIGIGSKRIHPKQIFDLEIYLPSKEEQRKILDVIESAEANNQLLLNELQRQEENLIKLRQSILHDAIQGKLTEKWREKNNSTQSALHLLEIIKKGKTLTTIQDKEIPFNIPDNWVWCRVKDFAQIQNGYAFKSSKFTSLGIRLLRNINISHSTINWNESVYYPENELKNLERFKLEKGDIVISLDRPLISSGLKISKISEIDLPSMLLQRVGRFKSIELKINSDFLYIWLNSNEFITKLTPSNGIGVPHISTKEIESYPFPMPTLEEQLEIVKKTSKLLSDCKNIEHKILVNKENAEKLIQKVFIELFGNEINVIANKKSNNQLKKEPSRVIKFNSKTTNIDLIKLLKVNGKLHAEDLWKMSEHYDDKNINDSIDKFYSDLKTKIEIEKTIKEVSNEKGYIELV